MEKIQKVVDRLKLEDKLRTKYAEEIEPRMTSECFITVLDYAVICDVTVKAKKGDEGAYEPWGDGVWIRSLSRSFAVNSDLNGKELDESVASGFEKIMSEGMSPVAL